MTDLTQCSVTYSGEDIIINNLAPSPITIATNADINLKPLVEALMRRLDTNIEISANFNFHNSNTKIRTIQTTIQEIFTKYNNHCTNSTLTK